jgi:uncharacterized protein YggU (UPF0235/DUF167 family)
VGPAGELLVKVRALPSDGAANDAVCRTIAGALNVAPSRVALMAGGRRRSKRIAVEDVSVDVLVERWPGLLTRAG